MLCGGLLLNPGDELLITDPGYPCNEVFALLANASPKRIKVQADHQFQPRLESIREAWTDSVRGALLASPANPTGTMLPAAVLREIADFIHGRDGFLILDEIYQGITREAEYASSLQVVNSDTFALNSFSKFFGMTGWRLGWLVLPEGAVEGVTKLAQNLFICPSAPAQHAALAAFEPAALAIHRERAEAFSARSNILCAGLRDLGFQVPVEPQGAFYLYVDISHTGMTSENFCWKLLNDFHVAVTPGTDFGAHQADRYVRFAYTTSQEQIELGLERIGAALEQWR